MGKKACLKVDLSYDILSDDYHDGDCDAYDDVDDVEEGAMAAAEFDRAVLAQFPPLASDVVQRSERRGDADTGTAHAALWKHRNVAFMIPNPKIADGGSKSVLPAPSPAPTPDAAPPKTKFRALHYVPNPRRLPLFSDKVVAHDWLLLQVASFLDIRGILALATTSRSLREALSADGLYRGGVGVEKGGMLLPCLRGPCRRGRLLPPIAPDREGLPRRRARGVSRAFAHESLMFLESGDSCRSARGLRDVLEPRTIMRANTSERQICAASLRRVRWEGASVGGAGRGPTPRRSWRGSGMRLSYVTNDAGNCALMSVWSTNGDSKSTREQGVPSTPGGRATEQYAKERYLPPNTSTIMESAIHSETGLCAMLATTVESDSLMGRSSKYVLSMIVLPTAPPRVDRPNGHSLKWQIHLPSRWRLFSSSETHAVVSFSVQGTYVIYGSTERWGVADAVTGGRVWSLSGAANERPSSFPRCGLRSTATRSAAISPSTSSVGALLIHHEFLFVLEGDGSLLRVYDVSDPARRAPLAEGKVPWSSVATPQQNWLQGPVRAHHSHRQLKEHLRAAYQLEFCAGRIWLTGMHRSDLICSSPPRLLRRLRSHLPRDDGVPPPLRFARAGVRLDPGVPHPMRAWNDTHLYVLDASGPRSRSRLHCWKSPGADAVGGADGQVEMVVSMADYIERFHVDATKIVLCANSTFRNATTMSWDASGSVWVIPIDSYAEYSTAGATDEPDASTGSGYDHCPKLVHPRPYSPIFQLFHKRLFGVMESLSIPRNGPGQIPRYPISGGGNVNHQILDMFSPDGRHIFLCCKKGQSSKIVILDLYSREG